MHQNIQLEDSFKSVDQTSEMGRREISRAPLVWKTRVNELSKLYTALLSLSRRRKNFRETEAVRRLSRTRPDAQQGRKHESRPASEKERTQRSVQKGYQVVLLRNWEFRRYSLMIPDRLEIVYWVSVHDEGDETGDWKNQSSNM